MGSAVVVAGARSNPYVQLARRSLQLALTYRAATLAGAFTNTVFGFLRASVLLAVIANRGWIGGLDATAAVTYAFLTQGLVTVVGNGGVWELSESIRSGDVVSDLYRPIDYQGYWAAKQAGSALHQMLFRLFPPLIVGGLFFHLRLPTSPWTWLAFGATVVVAHALSFGWRFLASLSGFWLLDTRGAIQLLWVLQWVGSGLVMPLTWMPDGVRAIVTNLPFAGMVQLPSEVFLGQHPGWLATVGVLARQLVWVALLAVAGRAVAARAYRRVVVQGG